MQQLGAELAVQRIALIDRSSVHQRLGGRDRQVIAVDAQPHAERRCAQGRHPVDRRLVRHRRNFSADVLTATADQLAHVGLRTGSAIPRSPCRLYSVPPYLPHRKATRARVCVPTRLRSRTCAREVRRCGVRDCFARAVSGLPIPYRVRSRYGIGAELNSAAHQPSSPGCRSRARTHTAAFVRAAVLLHVAEGRQHLADSRLLGTRPLRLLEVQAHRPARWPS
jgi:hypothetical protein